jgi:hypothetical protein
MSKFKVTPLQQGRVIHVAGTHFPLNDLDVDLTRSEAFELKTLLSRALADPDPRGDEETGR